MKKLLKALNQRPVAFYPIYVAATGSISSGVALSQLMYWFTKSKDKIYKTDKEFESETGHTAKEMQVVRKHLKKLPFLTITREGVPAKTNYEIDWDLFHSSIDQWSKLENEEGIITRKSIKDSTIGADCTAPIVQTITESTQRLPENTSPVTGKPDDVTPVSFTDTMIEALEVAKHLSSKLSGSIDNFKQPSIAGLHGWAKDIDLAIRKDNRTKVQLIDAINWIHDGNGSFWIGNVKSGKKLRSQFDTLTAQRSSSAPRVPIRTRAREAFGIGKVFFKFKDKASGREVHVCLFGDYGSLYDYRGNKYIDKVKADKVWELIDKNFDHLVGEFNKGS